jgi:preprotein translocase subunit SecA
VNNATYEQKDPLVIYKLEAYNLFEGMISRINESAVELLMNLDIPSESSMRQTNNEATQRNYGKSTTNTSISGDAPKYQSSGSKTDTMPQPVEKRTPVVVEQKINRNDPCPCGSGKKFKQCHGK